MSAYGDFLTDAQTIIVGSLRETVSHSTLERRVIRERTKAGLEAAVARGRKGGAPKKINEGNRAQAIALLADPSVSIEQACQTLDITRGTFYNHFPDGKRTKNKE